VDSEGAQGHGDPPAHRHQHNVLQQDVVIQKSSPKYSSLNKRRNTYAEAYKKKTDISISPKSTIIQYTSGLNNMAESRMFG
jgi:hypothetical protein